MGPRLCVITINYNSAEHTIEMVHSLRQAQWDDLMIVVVDNNSRQEDYCDLETAQLDAVLLRSEENLGFSGGNNIGLRYAAEQDAQYVMLLNNDTVVRPDALQRLYYCLQEGLADAVCPKICSYYDRGEIGYAGGALVDYKGAVDIYGIGCRDDGSFDSRREVTFASGCCVVMHMDTWKQLGFMEEKYFLYFEDTALSAKLQRLGKRVLYEPAAVIYHKESVSTQKFSDNYQYYFCRNRLLYSRENIAFPMRLCAYCYTALYMLKHLLKGEFSFSNIWAAVRDFICKKYGKRLENKERLK